MLRAAWFGLIAGVASGCAPAPTAPVRRLAVPLASPQARALTLEERGPHAPAKALVEAWRTGATIESVWARLTEQGFLYTGAGAPPDGPLVLRPQASLSADLDGDGKPEWLFLLANNDEDFRACRAPRLWIIGLSGRVLEETVAPPEDEAYVLSRCGLTMLGDLTGDGQPEIDVGLEMRVDNTLLSTYHGIYSLHGGALRDIAPAFDAKHGRTFELTHIEGDLEPAPEGRAILARQHLRTAAGYSRQTTATWAWNGTSLVLRARTWASSTSRIELLYDANHALDVGDATTARALYQRVIDDGHLTEWSGLDGEPESEVRANAQQFAAFRLVLAHGPRSAPARTWAAWLRAHAPRSPFTRATAVLDREVTRGRPPREACEIARQAVAGEDFGPLSRMSKWVPWLGQEALCPRE